MAVLLHDAGSLNKVTQTLLEMVRGGIETLPLEMSVFCLLPGELDRGVRGAAAVCRARRCRHAAAFLDAVRAGGLRLRRPVRVVGHVPRRGSARARVAPDGRPARCRLGQPAAVGPRHPGVVSAALQDQRRARRDQLLPAATCSASRICVLYGRYISDTLSAVRAVRAADALEAGIDLTHKRANQHLLSRLLRRRAEMLELPVQFVPISPEKVKRTSALDGLQSLLTHHRACELRADDGDRLLIIPAAGLGSRLGALDAEAARRGQRPADARSSGRPLSAGSSIDVGRRRQSGVRGRHRRVGAAARTRVSVTEQPSPTGMLDAILLAAPFVARAVAATTSGSPGRDQVGVLPATVAAARRRASARAPPPALALPTVARAAPLHPFRARRRGPHRPAAAAARRRRDAGRRRERHGTVCHDARDLRRRSRRTTRATSPTGRRDRRAQLPAVRAVAGAAQAGRDVPVHRSDGSHRHQHAGRAAAGRGLAADPDA